MAMKLFIAKIEYFPMLWSYQYIHHCFKQQINKSMTGSLKDEPSNGGHDWYQSGAPYEQSGDDPLHCQTALIV